MRWYSGSCIVFGAVLLMCAGCGPEPGTVEAGSAPASNAPGMAANTGGTSGEREAKAGGTESKEPEAAAEKKEGAEKGAPEKKGAGGKTGGGKTVGIVITTSMGPIEAELYPDKAPVTVKNFMEYVKKKHYDGTIFHRVIPTFMIQGGGFTPDMKEKATGAGISNEGGNGLKNERGTLAMARTSDPNSATAQFFINVKDNGFLNREQSQDGAGYAVFGKVTKGMDVVDKIKDVPTTTKGPFENVPTKPVVIQSIKLK
jgi:cyclophilin family peptidyl-prolyl cis-trans isomerase